MSLLARLGVVLGLDSAQFKAGLDDATKSTKAFEAQTRKAMRESEKNVKEFQSALSKISGYALAAGAAMLGAFRYADQISDTADAFDMTVASLMAMQGALVMSGGKIENTATMLQKLANNADAAREGTDKARESFTRLGIAGADVENLAPDELFARVAQALSMIDDPIKRNALAFEILGKAAKGVDWKTYWKEYSEGKSATDKVSEAVEAGAKAWDNLAKAGRAALEGLLVLLKPFADFINFLARAAEKTQSGTISGSSFDVEFGGAFGMTAEPFEAVVPKQPSAAAGAQAKSTGGGYSTLSDKERTERAATEAVRQQTIEYVRQVGAAIRKQQIESEIAGMTKNQAELYREVNKIEAERSQILQNIAKEMEVETAKGKDANQSKITALKEQIEVVNQLKNAEKTATEEIILARQTEQQSFVIGWERAFAQYAEDSMNYARLGEQAFSSVMSNMDNALSNFVQTGKLNFKNLAQSIIQDLIRIQLRMQAMQLFSYGKGFLGNIFGKGGSSWVDDGTGFMTLAGAADGGLINSPTIVGENGPELFIPQSAGTVIPNQQLSSVMGSQPQVVYNGPYIENMSAIDTQSATQFLAANKQAVYAANLSATRSLPASR